jgi:hypothetical protein
MNTNGVGRVHGNGLNGAAEFYYEAVEGSQNPGGVLLSPAAFINPAQYASVLEGRFKQLQGEFPWTEGVLVCPKGPNLGQEELADPEPMPTAFCDSNVSVEGQRGEAQRESLTVFCQRMLACGQLESHWIRLGVGVGLP